jgi:hypothetical protein
MSLPPITAALCSESLANFCHQGWLPFAIRVGYFFAIEACYLFATNVGYRFCNPRPRRLWRRVSVT